MCWNSVEIPRPSQSPQWGASVYFCVSGRLKAITESPLSGECAAPPTEISMYCLPVTGDT
jgi:hypothetical protein